MAKIETERGPIGFTMRGQGSATPIVFLHGVGSDKSVWHPQLDHFGGERRCAAFDYPGYGESDFVAGASRDDFAAAILAAMDSLEISRAHICGLSLGGVIAIAMAAAAPERCVSLILADTFDVHPDGQAIYDRSISASMELGMAGLANARAGALLGSAVTDAIRAEVIDTMSRIDRSAYVLGAEAVWLADQRQRVTAIESPTLVLCGDEDAITPPALSRTLADEIDGAEMVIIEGSGHLTNLEQPAAFNAALERFFRRIEKN